MPYSVQSLQRHDGSVTPPLCTSSPPSPSTCAVTPLCPRGRKDQDGREAEAKLSQPWSAPFDPGEWQCSWAGIYLFLLAA